jgi:NitT/TauT family transport system substrate-binding protein
MRKPPIITLLPLLIALLVPLPGEAAQLLRIGTNSWLGYEPLYLAAEHEHWRTDLDVRLVEYPSATEVIRAFRNRTLEAAALTLDEVLTLREAGIPLKVVAVLDVSAGADVILAKPDITTFSDLKGRRVGVESSALGAFVLTRALALNQMGLADIEIVHLDVSTHLRAFETGAVDAVVTFEPVRTKLLNGGAREVFSSRQIPGEVVDVLVVHADTLAREHARFRELLAGWFRALDYLHHERAAAAAFIARRLKITPQEVIESYQELELPDAAQNRRLLSEDLPKTLQRLQDTLVSTGLLRQVQDTGDLLEDRLLPQ